MQLYEKVLELEIPHLNMLLYIISNILIVLSYSLTYPLSPECFTWKGCISHHEADNILRSYKERKSRIELGEAQKINVSINLGLSYCDLFLKNEGISLTGDSLLATWDEIELVKKKENSCFALYDDGSIPWQISSISKNTGLTASLCPPLSRSGAPTLILGGFTMHRLAGDNMNPSVDTRNKIESISISPGATILDTCMGLGYTAIAASQKIGNVKIGKVVTVEYDEATIEIAAHNPWSKALFETNSLIEILKGDSTEEIQKMKDKTFDYIIHDPPAIAICRKDLYGLNFYKELKRVLKKRGSLFHYIGNPNRKESGRLYKGVIQRLKDAGFNNVYVNETAFGVTCTI